MATQRFGHLDDFTLKNTNVGIGTSTPQEKMEVIGGTRSQDLNVTGIATLTSAGGFIEKHTGFADNVNMTAGDSGTLSGEIVVGSGLTITVGTAATSSQGTVDALKVYDMFQPPSGGTNQRPSGKPGAIFYNFDFKTIEFFDGNSWRQVDNTTRSGRAFVAGGSGGGYRSDIQSFNINTLGNAINFGDLSNGARFCLGSASDGIRGIFYAGQEGPSSPRQGIDEITMASGGNSTDFGDASSSGRCFGGCGSSTRGIFGGINTGSTCDTIQFATKGSTVGSFITLRSGGNKVAMFSSPVRMISRQGENSGALINGQVMANQSIDTAIIASGGTTTLFGTLTRNTRQVRGTSNSVKGLFFGGYGKADPYHAERLIDSITIASTGNAIDFGDLITTRAQSSCAATSTRAVAAGGGGDPVGTLNSIEFVNINTTGTGQDFGDLYNAVSAASNGCSDSGGGLGGY